MKKKELLLPAGNFESFYAAVTAGADAVYVGLKKFSPKFAGINFTIDQIAALKAFCVEKNVRLLVTLNSVVKNSELPDLLTVLNALNQIQPYALIIQDFGILHISKKLFPNLRMHASIQMAFHNSYDLKYAQSAGFSRVVLARELTKSEMLGVSDYDGIESEMFVQGALCYSFSGVCLFSSYLGGNGANRNKCTEPCKKEFVVQGKREYPFSLKESFQLDSLPFLLETNIDAFKVEGRTKTPSYVYQIGKAYRKILDGEFDQGAKDLKQLQESRESTSWFLGDEVESAVSNKRFEDNYVGRVLKVKWRSVVVHSKHPLEFGDRLRVQGDDGQSFGIKIKDLKQLDDERYEIALKDVPLPEHGRIFLEGKIVDGFMSDLDQKYYRSISVQPDKYDKISFQKILGAETKAQSIVKTYVKIDSVAWLSKLKDDNWDCIILSFPYQDMLNLDVSNLDVEKLIFELPFFVSEDMYPKWRDACHLLHKKGVHRFMISQLSQKYLLPKEVEVFTNENIYLFNDAAIDYVKSEAPSGFVFPFENEYKNLFVSNHKEGIVPVFFHPKLFYSRMPVKNISDEGIGFADGKGQVYRKRIKDGITIVYPEKPVSFVHWRERLIQKGFRNFLFDFSGVRASKYLAPKVLGRFYASEKLSNSGVFNFEDGME